jgi:hypothetical protein
MRFPGPPQVQEPRVAMAFDIGIGFEGPQSTSIVGGAQQYR